MKCNGCSWHFWILYVLLLLFIFNHIPILKSMSTIQFITILQSLLYGMRDTKINNNETSSFKKLLETNTSKDRQTTLWKVYIILDMQMKLMSYQLGESRKTLGKLYLSSILKNAQDFMNHVGWSRISEGREIIRCGRHVEKSEQSMEIGCLYIWGIETQSWKDR